MKLHGKKILIIDDDDSLRLLLRRILESAGCVVDEAENVRLALNKVQAQLPDLIILDLNMPEHDGFTLLKFRAQNLLMHGIPILVLSATADKTIINRALAMGANQFLEKPLKANLVLQKLQHLFYSQKHFTYQFPADQLPSVTAEMNALITEHAEGHLKISSVAKFERGKPLQIMLENYIQSGGSVLVGKVDNRKIETDEGLYGQVLTLVGLNKEEKERLREWQRSL